MPHKTDARITRRVRLTAEAIDAGGIGWMWLTMYHDAPGVFLCHMFYTWLAYRIPDRLSIGRWA